MNSSEQIGRQLPHVIDEGVEMPRFRFGILCILTVFVAGCGNANLLEPIGIGTDRDSLKRSPCACYEIPQKDIMWKTS
jgi:hypothetical protein